MSISTRGGYCYFLTFTDDLSRYGHVYLMKHKSKIFEKFKEFQNEVENRRNRKIKFLRSDRGGEYLSYDFLTHLKARGIVSQLTPPGTLWGPRLTPRDSRYAYNSRPEETAVNPHNRVGISDYIIH
jgi:transposase InsO family protein